MSRMSTRNMADQELEEEERFCHDLLVKLKKTTEGLLAANSAQGVWGTYGGLRRVCLDAEAILCHGIKRSKASSESDGSFWHFIQGLKWLSPSLAPVIDKLNRHNLSRKLGGIEMGRAWLRESVQDHTLMAQLDILIGDEKHLQNYYHDEAFLRQFDCVNAMRICFKAIELGKPALLSEISPNLLRSGQASFCHSRRSSLPIGRALRLTGASQQLSACSHHTSGFNQISAMGNKHAHLNVTYSNQLSSSNLSLTVDPSLGASSLLHQKTLSDPYFVSSLDSPRALENLTSDPFTETVRYSNLANQLQNSRLQSLQQNSQSCFELPSQSSVKSHSQSSLDSNNQSHIFIQENGQSGNSSSNISKTANSDINFQPDYPTTIVVSSEDNSVIDHVILEAHARTSREQDEQKDSNTLVKPYSTQAVQPESTYQSYCQDVTAETDLLSVRSLTITKPHDILEKQQKFDNLDTTPSHIVNHSVDSQESTIHNVAGMHLSEADGYVRLHSVHQVKEVEIHTEDFQLHEDRGIEISVSRKSSEIFIGDPESADAFNWGDAASGSDSLTNFSANSNRAFDYNLIGATSPPTNYQAVPLPSSKTEIRINMLPETPILPRNHSYSSEMDSLQQSRILLSGADNLQPKIISVKSDPSINIKHPLTSLGDNPGAPNLRLSISESKSPGPFSPRPWADIDLYRESIDSPCSSPISKTFSETLKSSGNVYIPQPLHPGVSNLNPGVASGSAHSTALNKPNTSGSAHSTALNKPNTLGSAHSTALNKPNTSINQQSSSAPPRKLGHKRWVSDTSTICVNQLHQADVLERSTSSKTPSEQKTVVSQQNGQTRRRASEFESHSYQGNLTKPTEGQSLMSYLTSQDFNTCANLEKENAHFRICEALIEAFESMKFTRMMRRQETGKSKSSSDSSSDEEIQELRQRIRIRKREKMMAKVRPFPSLSDDQTDTATNSQTASSPVSSKNDFSSISGDSESDDDGDSGRNIDLTMSSDSHGNLTVIRSSGLNLSMASLYSDAELQRSNQQIEKNSSYDESTTPGSAESIAISLLRKFSEKHLPKASELKWLVSECDAPQRLLPLPLSTPVSPDDAENADLSTNRTRLRGNLEWAPPRAQIIFSVHPPEKRATLMSRQNFRCAGCGMRVDPAFMKRYRYCAYLGKYFCQCCHTGETSIIPGRVLEKWDFSRFPIANFSYTLLEKMWREPLFHVDTINPALYKRVRGLESIRECRQQLIHLQSLLAVCKRDALLLKEMYKMPSHWVSNDDAYSMEDFTQVRNGAMLNHIKSFISVAVIHVSDCQLCQGLGFICGMCQDQQVIFPFQLENVIKCPVCQACYHKDCFIPGKCPKCIRVEARRKLQQEPLSPESPESGESDDLRSTSQNVTADGSAL